jgi:hypothetical protein
MSRKKQMLNVSLCQGKNKCLMLAYVKEKTNA